MTAESMARDHYENSDIARAYGERSELLPAEKTLIDRFHDDIDGARILDVGCGGGRTSAALSERAGHYVGVDYAERMVSVARERFPDLDFRQGDATDLKGFADASVDFLLFSYNGLDSMSHAMRLRALAAIRRVLVPGGLFAFSSHNRDYANLVRHIDWRAGFGLSMIRNNARNLLSFLLVRHLEVHTPNYAVLSDPRLGFRQLSYFITATKQIDQLAASGFADASVCAWDGRESDGTTLDRQSMSLYYVCRNGVREGPAP